MSTPPRETKRLPVKRCARCGFDHAEIVYVKMERPVEDADGTTWAWWGTCPTTGDPILMRTYVAAKDKS